MENQTEPAREAGWAGRPGPTGPEGPDGGSPPVFPYDVPFSTSFFGHKILREV
jgi:hypothetical protein